MGATLRVPLSEPFAAEPLGELAQVLHDDVGLRQAVNRQWWVTPSRDKSGAETDILCAERVPHVRRHHHAISGDYPELLTHVPIDHRGRLEGAAGMDAQLAVKKTGQTGVFERRRA